MRQDGARSIVTSSTPSHVTAAARLPTPAMSSQHIHHLVPKDNDSCFEQSQSPASQVNKPHAQCSNKYFFFLPTSQSRLQHVPVFLPLFSPGGGKGIGGGLSRQPATAVTHYLSRVVSSRPARQEPLPTCSSNFKLPPPSSRDKGTRDPSLDFSARRILIRESGRGERAVSSTRLA